MRPVASTFLTRAKQSRSAGSRRGSAARARERARAAVRRDDSPCTRPPRPPRRPSRRRGCAASSTSARRRQPSSSWSAAASVSARPLPRSARPPARPRGPRSARARARALGPAGRARPPARAPARPAEEPKPALLTSARAPPPSPCSGSSSRRRRRSAPSPPPRPLGAQRARARGGSAAARRPPGQGCGEPSRRPPAPRPRRRRRPQQQPRRGRGCGLGSRPRACTEGRRRKPRDLPGSAARQLGSVTAASASTVWRLSDAVRGHPSAVASELGADPFEKSPLISAGRSLAGKSVVLPTANHFRSLGRSSTRKKTMPHSSSAAAEQHLSWRGQSSARGKDGRGGLDAGRTARLRQQAADIVNELTVRLGVGVDAAVGGGIGHVDAGRIAVTLTTTVAQCPTCAQPSHALS